MSAESFLALLRVACVVCGAVTVAESAVCRRPQYGRYGREWHKKQSSIRTEAEAAETET